MKAEEKEKAARSEAASIMGKKGGRSKSDRKRAASRENGKLGGRPRTKGLSPGEKSMRGSYAGIEGKNPASAGMIA